MLQYDYYYLRLSLKDEEVSKKEKVESNSIKSQRETILNFVKMNPDIDQNIIELCDDGQSGSNFDRPAIKKLLKLVENGLVRTIIVKDLSRFGREFLDVGYYMDYFFPLHKVRFIAINDNYDSNNHRKTTIGFNFAIQNMVNAMYSSDTSNKIKSVVDAKKMRGEYVYGQAPFGYKKGEIKNTIVVDDEAAIIVKYIFTLASSGKTVSQIAKILNEEKIITPSVYLSSIRGNYKVRTFWTYESVRNIINNRIYTGDTEPFKSRVIKIGSNKVRQIPLSERKIIENTHTAIISRDMFFEARNVIKSNKKTKKNIQYSVLTKYLICGCCFNKLSKGRATNKSFKCASARYLPSSECANVICNDEKVQRIVLNAIKYHLGISDTELAKKNNNKQKNNDVKQAQSKIAVLTNTIKSYKNLKLKLYENLVNNTVSKEEYLKYKTELAKKEKKLIDEVVSLEMKLKNKDNEETNDMVLPKSGAKFESLTEDLMKAFVKRIIILPDGSINIEWNFGSGKVSEKLKRAE